MVAIQWLVDADMQHSMCDKDDEKSMKNRRWLVLITAVGLATFSAAGVWWWNSSQPAPIPEHLQRMGGDFTLQSADGPVALADFRGKVVLIYFGYANCPDACPLTMSNWARAFKLLPADELSRVRGLLISVDPERDTPQMLKEYATFFHPNIIGVTGSVAALREVAALYRSDFVIEKEPGQAEYDVAHMSFVYVIDPQGKVRDLLAHESRPAEIVESIGKALKVKS